jgi:hypothetical protein
VGTLQQCREIKDHFQADQPITTSLFTEASRPACVQQALTSLHDEPIEDIRRLGVSIESEEPIYTGMPIKWMRKKVNLMDIEMQQVSERIITVIRTVV